MSDPNRREFLAAGAAVTFGACFACPLHAADPPTKKEPVDVGSIDQFAKTGIHDAFAKSHGFFLVRSKDRLYAVSAVCTHKRFALVSGDNKLKCPKHGSLFEMSGKPTKAPAKRPLPRLAIRSTDQGRVIVDPSKEFPEKQWTDPASYIAV